MKTAFGWILVFAAAAFGQYPTYPGCNDLKDSDFKETKLLSRTEDPTMDEPMKMDFYQDAQGNVNIYWIERAAPSSITMRGPNP